MLFALDELKQASIKYLNHNLLAMADIQVRYYNFLKPRSPINKPTGATLTLCCM